MNDFDVDEAIRNALRAKANSVTEDDLRPARPPTTDLSPRSFGARFGNWRWTAPLLAAAAVAAVVVGTSVVGNSLKADKAPPIGTGSPSPTLSTSPSPTPEPTSSAPSQSASQSTSTPPTTKPTSSAPAPATFDLGYEPLWPFATFEQAEQWRTSGTGSQPWHLVAGETALNFTRGYLGFTEIDRVTSDTITANDAAIGVGYLNPNGQPRTAAVLHLVRFGNGPNSPWEVVGSNDDPNAITIENPPYGSAVSSPITIGGHITGVDESIHVWVRSLASEQPVGEACCSPAGGERTEWSRSVQFTGSGTLTLVASTGGHLQGVEIFAIHGVHAG